jgi:hypothetical protein
VQQENVEPHYHSSRARPAGSIVLEYVKKLLETHYLVLRLNLTKANAAPFLVGHYQDLS